MYMYMYLQTVYHVYMYLILISAMEAIEGPNCVGSFAVALHLVPQGAPPAAVSTGRAVHLPPLLRGMTSELYTKSHSW